MIKLSSLINETGLKQIMVKLPDGRVEWVLAKNRKRAAQIVASRLKLTALPKETKFFEK